MNAGQEGLDRLKDVLAEVATSLPPRRPRKSMLPRRLAWVAAAAVFVVAAVTGGLLLSRKPPAQAPPPPVEILALRIDGEEARVEVIESPRAGSIVVVAKPGEAGARDRGVLR